MKYVTCEMQKIALAAFLLGVFSLSPLAKAEDAGESAVMTNGSSMSNTTTVAKKGDRLPTSDFVPERHPAAAPVLQSTAAGPAGDDASSDDDVSNIPAATRDGMKWNEIKNVSSSFKVTIDGDGTVHSLDPEGYGIGFRVTERIELADPGTRYNVASYIASSCCRTGSSINYRSYS